VRIKIASMNGSITNYAPEYEDCRRIAAEHRLPLKQVMGAAIEAYVLSGNHHVKDVIPSQHHPSEETAVSVPSRAGKRRAR
jgi:hypothetical protein